VTGRMDNLNKELQGTNKLFTNKHNNIKAFRIKLRLWENQLKLHNYVHFPRLKSLGTIFLEHIQEYSQSFSLLREEFDERFQGFKIMEREFLFVLSLKADVENAPKNLQMELINLQCDTNLTQKFFETDLQDFYSYLRIEKFPALRAFVLNP
jgi:hypothetical protein